MSYGDTIQKLREQCGPHAEKVRQLVAIKHDEIHAYIILVGGEKYLRKLAKYSGDQFAENLRFFAPFWKWFRMQWYAHDVEFIKKYRMDKALAPEIYLNYHLIQMESVKLDETVTEMLAATLKTPGL